MTYRSPWLVTLDEILAATAGGYRGIVTAATSTTVFAASNLAGFGNTAFIGWWVTPVWDAGGAGAAPQAEWRQISAYTSATGTFTHAAFTAQLAVTDRVRIVPPEIYKAMLNAPGAATIESLSIDHAADLDLAEYPTISLVCSAAEQTVYLSPGATADGTASGATGVYFFGGGFIDWTAANVGGGEDTVVKVYQKVNGLDFKVIYEETFLAAALPSPVITPFPRDVNTQCNPSSFYTKQDVKVTIQQAAIGAGWNTIDVRTIDGVRGG